MMIWKRLTVKLEKIKDEKKLWAYIHYKLFEVNPENKGMSRLRNKMKAKKVK